MENPFGRTQRLLSEEGMVRLNNARVAVFGIGGVGGHAVEALARSGIGALDLIDDDRVAVTNLNRQIIATRETLGQLKVDAAKARVLSISPECVVRTYPMLYLPETAAQFDFSHYSYVIDAIDTVAGKLALAQQTAAAGVPIISCMGAGNKLDATAFEVADIQQTSVCPLARVMRRELKKRGIAHLKVVYSKEAPLTPIEDPSEAPTAHGKRQTPGSTAFVPAVAGLILAGEVIRDLSGHPRA